MYYFQKLVHSNIVFIEWTADPGLEIIESGQSDDLRVKITLPDGYKDVLNLKRHYLNDGERLDRIERCNFIGHLESDKKAGVALTGCLGQEDVMTTILFQNQLGAKVFLWELNGEVQEIVSLLFHNSCILIKMA